MKIRKNDEVLVIAGADRGKRGKVRFAFPSKGTIIIEGVNFIKKHSKPKAQVRQTGIIEREAAIKAASVMLICSKCNHPARIGYRKLEDGRRVRFCHACGEVID